MMESYCLGLKSNTLIWGARFVKVSSIVEINALKVQNMHLKTTLEILIINTL